MRNKAFVAAGLLAVALAACSSSEPEAVVEQIVVREPGEPARSSDPAGAGGAIDKVALGEEAFSLCSGCHNADPGGPHQSGPNLHGVFGMKAGSKAGYPYSDALASSGITWDYATLDRFLSNPAAYVEGTSMVAGAVRNGEERAAIVAYLASTSEGSETR